MAILATAYLLLVTAVYTGTMGMGSVVDVRFQSDTETRAVCFELEKSIVRTLTKHGASDIRTAGCPEKSK